MNRKKGVIFSYILIAVEALCSVFFSPFIIKTLGQSTFGVYKLALSISSYATLLDLGVGQAVVKFLVKYRVNNDNKSRDEFFSIICLFYIIMASIIAIIGLAFSNNLVLIFSNGLSQEELVLAGKLVMFSMLSISITIGFSVFYNAIIAYEFFSINKILAIIQILVRTGLCVFALINGKGVIEIVIIELLTNLSTRIAMAIITFAKTKIRLTSNINFKLFKEAMSFSTFVIVQMIALQITQVTDQVILGIIVPGASVVIAIYSVGVQIVGYFNNFANAINGVIMPGIVKVAEKSNDSRDIANELVKISRITTIILGAILAIFAVFGQAFINLWVGSDYLDAYYVCLILMFTWFLLAVISPGSQVLWALNVHKYQAIIAVIVSVLNIILTIFMILWNPILGSAISTSISLLIGNFGGVLYVLNSKIKINILEYLIKVFKPLLIVIVSTILFGIFIMFLSTPVDWATLLLDCFIVIIFYVLSMAIYGMNIREKRLFFGKLFRI